MRRLNAKEVIVRESTPRREQLVRSEDLKEEELQGNSERPRPTESKGDAEARNDFWSMQGDFIHRHHVEARVQLCVPKEEAFPIPLKYIDVTRTTHTHLDVVQERRIDDYGNVDVDRNLSDPWTGFTKFTSLNEKPPKGFMWSMRGLQKSKQSPDLIILWPGIRTGMSKTAQQKEKQEWAIEKPKLDNARRQKGIYFIDPEDGVHMDTMKNARRKLGIPMEVAMPHSTIRSRKIPDAKAALDKGWEKLEKLPAWQLSKVKSKKEVIKEAQKKKKNIHFATLMDICHLKNAELEPKHQKYKGRAVFRGDILKDDSGSYAVFTEQGSSASQMTAAKVMDVLAGLPDCAGQAADAVSVYPK